MIDGTGGLEILCGPMYAGKSTELMHRLRRAQIGRQSIQVFKPSTDTRGNTFKLSSHDKVEFEATPVANSQEVLDRVFPETQVVGLDEAQFFDDGIVQVAQTLADRGVRVIVAGLDTDYRAEPFGSMPALLAIAETVDKLTAVCMVCGGPATRTQRLSDSHDLVEIGAQGKYEARCRKHHEL